MNSKLGYLAIMYLDALIIITVLQFRVYCLYHYITIQSLLSVSLYYN